MPSLALLAPDLALWADEPLTTSALVVGSSVYAVLGVLALLALVALPLRGFGLALHAARWWQARQALRARGGAPLLEPPPLHLEGLSPGLVGLARQTRTLSLELRRCALRAEAWPEDRPEAELGRSGWSTVLGEGLDYAPLLQARREVFEWLHTAERLEAGDRASLQALGVDPEHVRSVLTREGPVAGSVRDLAGLLAAIDQRFGVASAGYRGATSTGTALVPRRSEDDEEETRRAAILRDHQPGITSVARRYARSRAEREDLEQDIALALWQALPDYRGEARLDTFVYRIARYRCYRELRHRGRWSQDPDAPAEPVDPSGDPETHLLRADDRARLQHAIDRLPGKLARTIGLHLHGHSYAEIAAELGITEHNVSARLSRARRRLALELA